MTQIKQFDESEIKNESKLATEHYKLVENLKQSLIIGQTGFLKSGAYLKKIKDDKTYKYEDSTRNVTFKEFLERPDIPIPGKTPESRKRIAYKLIKIYNQLIEIHGIPEETLAPIGWTKLSTVATIVEKNDGENIDEWISKAEVLSAKDLEDEAMNNGSLTESLACGHDEVVEINLFKCTSCGARFKDNPNEREES